MSTYFDDFCWFWSNFDVGTLSLVSLWNYLSVRVEHRKWKSVQDLSVYFSVSCSWNPRWTQTWYALGLQFGLDTHVSLLIRWWPRWRTALGIFWQLGAMTKSQKVYPLFNILCAIDPLTPRRLCMRSSRATQSTWSHGLFFFLCEKVITRGNKHGHIKKLIWPRIVQ